MILVSKINDSSRMTSISGHACSIDQINVRERYEGVTIFLSVLSQYEVGLTFSEHNFGAPLLAQTLSV